MFRIAYSSTLRSGVGGAEIVSIAQRAAEKNGAAGLRGVWLLSGTQCLGALEGDPRLLRGTIESIWDDPRHSDFTILEMGPRSGTCLDWPFLLVRQDTLAAKPELIDHPGLCWLADHAGGMTAFFHLNGHEASPDSGAED